MKPMPPFPGKLAGSLLAMPLLLSMPMEDAVAHHEGGQHAVERHTPAQHAEAPQAGAPPAGTPQAGTSQAGTSQAGTSPEGRDDGARLAATCTGCHGTDGKTVGDALPALAGQSKQALLASLMAFKSGGRSATVMTQLAKGYSDQDLEKIAAFFAAQKASAAVDGSSSTQGTSAAAPSSAGS